MEFYKGFVKTENKVSHEKRSGETNFPTRDQVKDYPEYAGILADGIVLVDFDDSEQAKIAVQIIEDLNIPCRAIKTSRGVHILFRSSEKIKERTKCNVACGLSADFKTGFNNSYEVLKFDGVEREVIIDTGISELPYFFRPVPKPETDLWKMKDGDGRNDKLFRYEIQCIRSGLTKAQIRDLFTIINKYVFEDPLSDSEIKSITRDGAFEKILANGKKPDLRMIADLMIAQDHIIRINNRLNIQRNREL